MNWLVTVLLLTSLIGLGESSLLDYAQARLACIIVIVQQYLQGKSSLSPYIFVRQLQGLGPEGHGHDEAVPECVRHAALAAEQCTATDAEEVV